MDADGCTETDRHDVRTDTDSAIPVVASVAGGYI